MSYTPKRPSGTSDLAQLLGWMWDRIQALEISDSQTIKVTRTPRHTVLDVRPSTDSIPGLTYKGEYAFTSYNTLEMVSVIGGVNAGTYIALESVTETELPWESSKWVQLAKNDTIGSWT
jgi:hypothetical protein